LAKRFQFPDPTEVTADNPLVWRSREQILRLYNASKPSRKAKNVSATVEEWVRAEAAKRGWKRVVFPLEYPSHTLKGGAVFGDS
jgi:hypothetical protein